MTSERRGEKTRSRLKIAIVLNLVIFLVLGFGFGREYLRNREIEQEIARMEEENDRLEADRLEAMHLIEDLSSTYYLEGEARTKRGLGEPGETMIIVKDDNDDIDPATSDVALADTSVSNPLRWYFYFFDHVRFAEIRSAGEASSL